jgi:transposase
MRFDLIDEERGASRAQFSSSPQSARADDRKIMNAIFFVLRTGIPWRELPEGSGLYTAAYNRFNRWLWRGIWKKIFDTLASKSRDSLHLIDSMIVKAHRAAKLVRTFLAAAACVCALYWIKLFVKCHRFEILISRARF